MSSPAKKTATDSVVAILDEFLTWSYENRATRTADRYKDFCQSFCDTYGRLRVADLDDQETT